MVAGAWGHTPSIGDHSQGKRNCLCKKLSLPHVPTWSRSGVSPVIFPCHLPLSSSHLFAEESIATSHNQERAFSPLVRERYEKLCSMCERIVAALNDFLGAVTCDLPIINVDNRTAIQNIENCVFKFGMSAKRGEQMPSDQQRFSISRWSGSSILLQRKPK